MKKTLLGVIIVGAAFVLSGCAKPAILDQSTAQNQQGGSVKNSVISSIKDAIGLGTKMKCTYKSKDVEDSYESVVYVEGQKYKSEATIDGKKMYGLFDGETMYSWSEGEKKGTKMTMSCISELEKMSPKGQESTATNFKEEFKKEFEDATDTNCVPFVSADFSVPSGITFEDQCQMMKNMIESLKNMKLPSGANIPNMPNIPAQ